MVKKSEYFLFLLLFVLVGCGGGGAKSNLKELSLNTGGDPKPSEKNYKPSNKLIFNEDKLLENLKKQQYQTEVAIVPLPKKDAFLGLSEYLMDDLSSPNPNIGIAGVKQPVSNAESQPIKSKKEVKGLLASVQITGSLQDYFITSAEKNQIHFVRQQIYYFMRPSSANDFAVMFLKINAEQKEITKVLSDDSQLVFHVYEDGRTFGFTAPSGQTIRLVIEDKSTKEIENIDLVFNKEEANRPVGGNFDNPNTLVNSSSTDTIKNNSESNASGNSSNFTDTNNQVAGVSEADRVKTDGFYIYSLDYNILKIYDVKKEETISSTTINFDAFNYDAYALSVHGNAIRTNVEDSVKGDSLIGVMQYVSSEINLVDNNLVVFSQFNEKTIVTFINLADKTSPIVNKQLTFSESLVSSRIMNNQILLVLNNYLYAKKTIEIPYHYAFTVEQQEKFTKVNENLVKDLTLTDFGLTDSFEKTVDGNKTTVKYLDTKKIYIDEKSGGYSLSKVLVLDASAAVVSATGVLTDYTQNIYVANDAVVLFNTSWESRIEWWSFDWSATEKTMIYYFSLLNGVLDFQDGVEVLGRPQGVFSFHKKENNLFMAFHDDISGDNGIHTIAVGEELQVTHTLSDVAKGEILQSVRFIEDKAYLVTFKTIDPFYIVDLKEPNNPVILGELKTTGFSSYLHLVLDDVILGVGSENTEEGMMLGAKVSTFDVSKNNPSEIDKATILGTYIYYNAAYDHHAFTWYNSRKLLALTYSGVTSGAIVYRLDDSGNILNAATIASPNKDNNFYYYSSLSGRILFIDDTLYYVDGGKIHAYPIDTLEFLSSNKNLLLQDDKSDAQTIYNGNGLEVK